MTRRHAWLAVLGLFLSARRIAHAAEPGVLTIDLNQWSRVVVKQGDRSVTVTPQAIFNALKETT